MVERKVYILLTRFRLLHGSPISFAIREFLNMTPDKCREVIAIYRENLEEIAGNKADFPHDDCVRLDQGLEAEQHCLGMLDKMEVFIDEGRMDKVYRWLGFLQGVLWMRGLYTLTELMNHNKKDEKDKP